MKLSDEELQFYVREKRSAWEASDVQDMARELLERRSNPAVIRLMQQNVELLLEINALRGIITKMEDHYMSAEAQKFPREVYE